MALKILIADDSMTAQNMGKKILVDAGFEVVPVSNGAAAIKKIAETKPDLIILDIYMPGYTGLEVCEKVKAAPETANVPVLLTVGKLEPYRPEEGAKVKAEGVIIKPFEATDLLTALGRIAQKYNLQVPQIEPIEIKPREQKELPQDESYASWKKEQTLPEYEATVRTDPPPGASTDPAYEKTMRLSATDLHAMLAKTPSPAAATPAPAYAEPVAEPAESTQKIEIPSFVKHDETPAAALVVVPEAAPVPMFSIEETPAESAAPAYSVADLTPPSQEAPAYLMDELMGTPTAEPHHLSGAPSFSASSIPDETGSFMIGGMAGANLDPETMYPELPNTSAAVDALALEFSANTASYQPAASDGVGTQHELETFSPVAMPEVHHVDPDLETTAAAKVEGHVEELAELETTHQSVVDVPHVVDPALVTNPDELMQFTIKVGTDKEETHVEHDPLAKELVASLYDQADFAATPAAAEPVAEAEAPIIPEVPAAPHTYADDPLVQMGVISIAPETSASPELVNEFNKPVVEDEQVESNHVPEPVAEAAPVIEAVPVAETAPVVESLPEVPAAVVETQASAQVAEQVPDHTAEEAKLKKLAEEFHEAISAKPVEPHVEPEHPQVAEVIATTAAAAAPLAAMAAASATSVTASENHELAASLSAALESAAHGHPDDTKKFGNLAALDAMHVARAVQKVFERYKAQMVADITDELQRGD